MAKLRASLLQLAPLWEDRRATRERVALLVDGLVTDWLVLPEMALSGFTMDLAASTWDGEDGAFFSDLARRLDCVVTVGAVRDRRNLALAFGRDGSLVSSYAKRQLFSFSGEDRHYEAGDGSPPATPPTYEVAGLRVAPAICYDLRFPYNFWRAAPAVDAFCVIAAWGAARADHWKTLLRARAIENQAFVVGVNRTGSEPGVGYSGDSAVIDPRGGTVLDCGSAEGVFSADIEVDEVRAWRAGFPALRDRLE